MPIPTLEDLEDTLQSREQEREDVLADITPMFEDAGFEIEETKNYIAFLKDEGSVKAMFSIDNTSYKYSCYITSDETPNNINYSAKGELEAIVEFVPKFLGALDDIIVDSEEEQIDSANEDDLID